MASRADIRVVSDDDLERLWRKHNVPEKIAKGILRPILAHEDQAKDPSLKGIVASFYFKILTQKGTQIGTMHEVRYVDDRKGEPPLHSHPKDYVMRDGTTVRTMQKDEKQPKRRNRKRVELWHPPELD